MPLDILPKTPLSSQAAFEAWLDWPALVTGGRVQANWLPDGRFWFVEGAPDHTRICVFDPKDSSLNDLFDPKKVRAALQQAAGKTPPFAGLPFETFSFDDEGGAIFAFGDETWRLSPDQSLVVKVPKPNYVDALYGLLARGQPQMFIRPTYFAGFSQPAPEAASPDGKTFAGVQAHNLALRSSVDGRVEILTDDGTADRSWDVESIRMGVGAGAQIVNRTVNPWSPDGLKLYASKLDMRRIAPVTRTHWLRHVDEVETFRMSRTGDALAETLPFVVDVLSRRFTPIQVSTEDVFTLPLSWSPDSRLVFLARFSRDCSHGEVIEVEAGTGSSRVLFSETGATFIRIQHDVVTGRSGCTVLPDRQGFLWESERTGWKHLYHYDADGRFVGQVTSGDWPAIEVQSFDPKTGQVYFTAHHDQERPYDVHLCRVALSGGQVERLTEDPGQRDVQIAPDFGCFVETVSRPDFPPQSVVRACDGRRLHTFPQADVSRLEAIGWTRPEEFCVKAADGETDLWGVIYKPADFDPSKSYPVINALYGGPQLAFVSRHFGDMPIKQRTINQALPQLGYIVVAVDARGTPERSKAFQDVAFKEWRRHVTADHAQALRNLAKDRPWMDLGRVGVWGHSWGGYFTFACLVDAPDLYKAGFSSAPSYDPYDLFIYEPYLGGVPGPENKAAYEDARLYADAPKLQGRLTIFAGSNDLFVWHGAVKMTRALIDAGKDHELIMAPEEGHGFGTAADNYWVAKLTSLFDLYVKGAKAPT